MHGEQRRDGGRRGLILPGLWYKLVLERRKRYSGERERKTERKSNHPSLHPSVLLSIQYSSVDAQGQQEGNPAGFLLGICVCLVWEYNTLLTAELVGC